MGASESDVERLILESHRIKQNIDPFEIQQREEELSFIPNFDEYVLPDDFISFTELFKLMETNPDDIPEEAYYAIKYVIDRKVDINKYEFYWTPTDEYKFRDRLYVPFYWKNKIVGYTGRTLDVSNNVKYLNLMPQNYVFNIDKQLENSEIVIVAEGIFDALSIDGVAVMHNHISDEQAKLIEYLGKEIIVVPDFDKKAGVGLIQDAIKHGWPVSFPLWADNCKDINEAIVKYGKLFVLKCIIDAVEKNELKIKLKTRSKFGPNKV
jgi:hypothetical protein